MKELSPCIATADEPIANLIADRWSGPDMKTVMPIEMMLGVLHQTPDASAYLKVWLRLVETFGGWTSLIISRDGEEDLRVGLPMDPQMRHRNRWHHFLTKDLNEDPERRDLLISMLIAQGRYADNRPADPRVTTRAMRDFLRSGGRILIEPDGKLTEGAGLPRSFTHGSDAEVGGVPPGIQGLFRHATALAFRQTYQASGAGDRGAHQQRLAGVGGAVMTGARTPIRALMDLRHVAARRNERVEAASKAGDWPSEEWALSSRVWSRQGNALRMAVLAEPPADIDDVVSVLICLAEKRHEHDMGDDQSPSAQRDSLEVTDVAIQNCIVALARHVVPQQEYTETEISDIDWNVKQAAHWLPKARDAWTEAATERARLEAAENAADAAGDDTEAELQQSLRFLAEDKLMAMPAPDGEGLALKVLIAISQDRASIPYQEAIEADARRLSGMETLS